MNVLVLNSGSSSIKFQLILMPSEELIGSGIVERIGEKDAAVSYKTRQNTINQSVVVNNHNDGLLKIADLLRDTEAGVIKDTNDIHIVGHRVVHGGNSFSDTT